MITSNETEGENDQADMSATRKLEWDGVKEDGVKWAGEGAEVDTKEEGNWNLENNRIFIYCL